MATVRFAEMGDLTWCAGVDRDIGRAAVRRKIVLREIVLSEVGGELVGYLRLEYLWSKLPYVGLVRVQEEFRRLGVGRAIVYFLEDFLRERGYKVLMSSSQVNEPSAQAWHRAVGFEECGIIAGINEKGIGEVFFRKFLGKQMTKRGRLDGRGF